MERGIYFDGWYENNHCYHPSLPFRSMQMICDIEKYKGTMLVWSALGGGSISLPFLEHEAYGEVDPRLRFYGYMNDSEFIKECDKRGIKVFGIVFEVQGWEFPALIGKDKNNKPVFKALNIGECDDWYGLREFTQDKHWEIFGKKLSDYYPDGLYNSDGEQVTDIWEECCARTWKGEPVHADWVEVKNHGQIAYQMCRNNPVWRNYLKKIMEIQIDAGVHGIQLDECELPMTSIGPGGCFCKDCMKEFNTYLKEKDDPFIKTLDLDNFHYGKYLIENNLDYPVYYEDAPLYKYYWEYQLRAIKKYFKELVDHGKKYAKRDIQISGNFFTVMPSYFHLEPFVDVIITEMKNTLFKQPAWYRYAAGFARGKTIIVAENPYGGIIPDLLNMLDNGKGYDLYKIFLIEASMYGCNMAVPYGGWMGNTIKDAFYPPRDITEEVQSFLANNEKLFSKKSGADIAIIWSFPSYYWREAIAGYSNNIITNADKDLLSYSNEDMDNPNSSRLPFWEVARRLADNQICYDVITTADGDLKEDDFCIELINNYNMLVLPDCFNMTKNQIDVIKAFIKNGGNVLIWGRFPEKLDQAIYCDNPPDKLQAIKIFEENFKYNPKYILNNKDLGVQCHKMANGNDALHLLNYNYNKETDQVPKLDEVIITVKNRHVKNINIFTLKEICDFKKQIKGQDTEIIIKNAPLYLVLELE